MVLIVLPIIQVSHYFIEESSRISAVLRPKDVRNALRQVTTLVGRKMAGLSIKKIMGRVPVLLSDDDAVGL